MSDGASWYYSNLKPMWGVPVYRDINGNFAIGRMQESKEVGYSIAGTGFYENHEAAVAGILSALEFRAKSKAQEIEELEKEIARWKGRPRIVRPEGE